jgi:glycolate oxidase iron-sulfur subunit
MNVERSRASTGEAVEVAKWRGTQDCVHCGLCLTSCPTYLATGVEMSSPRGRIWLMRALAEGDATLGPVIVKHLDQCVGCLACQEACPSQVPYAELIDAARETIGREFRRPAIDRWSRRLVLQVFPYPRRLGPALTAVAWYRRLGLAGALRRSGLLAWLLPRLDRAERLLPRIPSAAERRPLPPVSRATGARRGRVGLLTGCAQRHLAPGLNRATVRVLTRAGYDVIAPREQGCCGALHLHTGDRTGARELARRLIGVFEATGADLVVANAAGCGAVMKDYGRLLADDPAWRSRAEGFSRRIRDVSEVVADIAWDGALRPLRLRVTYHDACHLAHAQGIRAEPRALLERIPGLELVPLQESDVCCGSGGLYNLLQPGMAHEILDRKVESIRATGADVVAMGNLGCLLQVGAGLRGGGVAATAAHPIEILDWSLCGTVPR